MADDLDLSALFLPLEKAPQMLNYSDPAIQQALINTLIGGASPNMQQQNSAPSGWGYPGGGMNPMDQAVGATGVDPRMQMMGTQQPVPMTRPGQAPDAAPQTMPW